MTSPFDIKLRGNRMIIPSGYILGRTDQGVGPPHLIHMRDLNGQLARPENQGAGGSGGRGGQGPAGQPGLRGPPGGDGSEGPAGQDGNQGRDGQDGAAGAAGAAGPASPGLPGQDGEDGAPGQPGLQGLPGPPGMDTSIPGRDGEDGQDSQMGALNTPFNATVMPLDVYLGSNSILTTNTYTHIPVDTVTADIEGAYDRAINYRYTPKVAGVYLVQGSMASNFTDLWGGAVAIYKNGAAYAYNYLLAGGTSAATVEATAIVNMNGTTDYLELWGLAGGSTSPTVYGGATLTFMKAVRLRLG